ncbi:MAG: glycosyl hydrolase [Rhodothermales bacterium]
MRSFTVPRRVVRCCVALLVALSILVCGTPSVLAQSAGDALRAGFESPPDAARPRVWWHWMNGNVTREGVRLDFEWMKRAGIAGIQNFDASLATPRVVDTPLIYMTPAWKDVFAYTASLADKKGLEMAIAGSPGWSETGGPWVMPEDGMKKYVWSETGVAGGRRFAGVLPAPPQTTGPFQDAPFTDELAALGGATEEAGEGPHFYADARVIAFRLPDGTRLPAPAVTSSSGAIDAGLLSDNRVSEGVVLPVAEDGEASWIAFDYGRPVVVNGVTYGLAGAAKPFFGQEAAPRHHLVIQASDDGLTWRDVGEPATGFPQRTTALPPTRARYFRFVATLLANQPPPAELIPGVPIPPPPTDLRIGELALRGVATVHRFEEKTAFALNADYFSIATTASAPGAAIAPGDVVDLTDRLQPDGTLRDWTPPAGDWQVLRFGYSLQGTTNHPASPEATGLEVDKLDAGAVRRYIDNYLDQYKSATKGLMGARGLRAMIFDSYEAGTGNWSPHLLDLFRERRGYDPTPYLPTLAGYVVGSAAASDRFLWDFRKTIMDALQENHYGVLADALHERGMIAYVEGHESLHATLGDGMEMKMHGDIPMAAMWTKADPGVIATDFFSDIRESASVAHLYGQNIVACESMTAFGPVFAYSPWMLKPTADAILLAGVNRFVIHTSVHQPLVDQGPGLTLGPFGQYFSRHETWAEQARPWIDYLARSSHLLQQGRAVSDILLFYGEGNPVITRNYAITAPGAPAGYQHDFVNSHALTHRLSVEDGRLVTPDGTSYRVIYLAGHRDRVTLATLERLRELVEAGAVVVGKRPVASPSLSDDPAAIQALLDALWPGDGVTSVGRGRVYTDGDIAAALAAEAIAPDFTYTGGQAGSQVLFLHRTMTDGDLYFLSNRKERAETIEATFRVEGKTPELWDPATGTSRPASYRIVDGATMVTVPLDPYGSVFVVFRTPATEPARLLPAESRNVVATLDGSWEVAFQKGRGAPAKATFDALTDWSAHADAGIKYFSGTATYAKTFQADAGWKAAGTRVWLDLGDVKDLAEVTVNGRSLGILWKEPFRVDITDALKTGRNTLRIAVTNLWVNRLIGDVQPGAERIGWTTADVPGGNVGFGFRRYPPDAPLRPSGLMGPMRVVTVTEGR